MLVLLPPHSSQFSTSDIAEFRDECLSNSGKMHGDGALHWEDDVQQWLRGRPWLGEDRSMLFLSWDTDMHIIVGCIRVTLYCSGAGIAFGWYNIGYTVRPSLRCRGYGTQQLKLALELMRSFGDGPAFISAHRDNVASRKVIENCGGVKFSKNGDSVVYFVTLDIEG